MKLLNIKTYKDKVTKQRWDAGTTREENAKRAKELIKAGVAQEVQDEAIDSDVSAKEDTVE